MEIYPAIDIRHGEVVQLVGGDPDQVAVQATRTPVEQAEHWRKNGARRLHVVDLDGAFGESRQWPAVSRIIGSGLPVHFGGGVRSMLDIQKLLDLGIKRVIVGTQGVENPEWLRELAGLWPGRIILAVDARGREVVVKGWTKKSGHDVIELVRSFDDANLGGFLYTNVEKEGRLAGIDVEVVRDLRDAAHNTRLIISGGISNDDDLATLAALDVDGVVLGMSLYKGTLDLQKIVHQHEAEA